MFIIHISYLDDQNVHLCIWWVDCIISIAIWEKDHTKKVTDIQKGKSQQNFDWMGTQTKRMTHGDRILLGMCWSFHHFDLYLCSEVQWATGNARLRKNRLYVLICRRRTLAYIHIKGRNSRIDILDFRNLNIRNNWQTKPHRID